MLPKQSPAAKVRQEIRADLLKMSKQQLNDLITIAVWLAEQDRAQKNLATGNEANREIIDS